MTKHRTFTALALALFLACGLAMPAAAAEKSLEGYLGYYDPDSYGDHGEVFGARFGYRPNEKFGVLVSTGVIDLEDDFLNIDNSQVRLDLFLIDFSFQLYPGGKNFYLFAGPGWATIDLKIDQPGPSNNIELSDDIFTIHGGLGYKWQVGESFFVRAQGLARWFEGQEFEGDQADSYDGLDTEYSLGFGWSF
jgi:hypothetical protein